MWADPDDDDASLDVSTGRKVFLTLCKQGPNREQSAML